MFESIKYFIRRTYWNWIERDMWSWYNCIHCQKYIFKETFRLALNGIKNKLDWILPIVISFGVYWYALGLAKSQGYDGIVAYSVACLWGFFAIILVDAIIWYISLRRSGELPNLKDRVLAHIKVIKGR